MYLLALPPWAAREHVCHSDMRIVCTKMLARNVNIKLGPRSIPAIRPVPLIFRRIPQHARTYTRTRAYPRECSSSLGIQRDSVN